MAFHSFTVGLGLAAAFLGAAIEVNAQSRDNFDADDESQIWRELAPLDRSAARCLDADGDGYPERLDYLWPVQCPADAPLANDELYYPVGVSIFDPGTSDPARLSKYRVYVADWTNHRVAVFDYQGRALPPIGAGGIGLSEYGEVLPPYSEGEEYPEGRLLYPEGVSVDAAGTLLVTDTSNGRLQAFNDDGAFLFTVPMPASGRTRSQRGWPSQVAVLAGTIVRPPATNCSTLGSGRIAVSTTPPSHPGSPYDGLGQVLVYDEKFCPVATLGQPSPNGRLKPGSFAWPSGVVFDSAGRLIVTDSLAERVQVFAPISAGTSFLSPILSLSQGFNHPYATMVDRRGRLVVSDTNNHRIAVFAPDYSRGTARLLFEKKTDGATMPFPHVIAQDASSRYVVAAFDGVHAFDVPALAVFDERASVTAVRVGQNVDIRFSIVVPPGKSDVSGVEPTMTASGPVQRVSGPTVIVGEQPRFTLDTGDVVTFSYRYRALDASAAATFTVGARGYWSVVAPSKKVVVRILCSTCEDVGPNVVAKADPSVAVANAPVNVTFEASDATTGSSGVEAIMVRFAGAEEFTRRGPFALPNDARVEPFISNLTITQPGTTKIEYWAVDALGNEGAPKTLTVSLDLFGPDVFFSPRRAASGTSPDGRQWWNAPVDVDVEAWDDFTAEQNIRFLEGGPTLRFTQQGVDQAQTVTLADEVGNESTFYTLQENRGGMPINIDTVPPVTVASEAAGAHAAPFTVTLTAADALSGVKEIRASTKSGALTAVAGPIAIGGGRTTLRFQAVDYAGNVELERSLVFVVNSPPTAMPDLIVTTVGNPRSVDVIRNDSDPEGDALTVVSATPGERGTTTVTSQGITYSPAGGFVGADRFTYIVRDSNGSTSVGTVFVFVLPETW
jgi:sugar lactone lactonase YvrE